MLTRVISSEAMPTSFLSLTGWNDVFHEVLNHLERPVDDVHDNEDYDGEIYRAALSTFRNALLSLALSCRAFLDPSLDKLWHDLHDILPLLELLPNYERRGRVHVSHMPFKTCCSIRYVVSVCTASYGRDLAWCMVAIADLCQSRAQHRPWKGGY